MGFTDMACDNSHLLGLFPVDQWYWLDGTEYFYNNWAPGEPNNPASELCGVTMVDGTSFPSMWNDVSCDTYDYQYFVCEGSLGN